MKRPNPDTGKLFKRGDVGETGLLFWQYVKKSTNNEGFFNETWVSLETFKKHNTNQNIAKIIQMKTKRGHLMKTLLRIRFRAKQKNIPFDIDIEHLESIAVDSCPIFKTKFDWGLDNKGNGRTRPSLDKIIPELGYIKGNVAFISTWANLIKSDATEKELYAVADWLHEARKKVLNAQKNTTTPVPTGPDREGQVSAELGAVPTTGAWQDHDDLDDYRGATQGANSYRSAKEGR